MRTLGLGLGLSRASSGGGLVWPDAPEDADLIGEGAVVGEYDDTETAIELTPDIYDEIEPGDVLQVQSTGELMRVVSKDGSNVATVARGHGGTTPEAIPNGGKVRGYRPHFQPATLYSVAEDIANSSTTVFSDVFSIPLEANTHYEIDVLLGYTSAATTTGLRMKFVDRPTGAKVFAAMFSDGGFSTFMQTAQWQDDAAAIFARSRGATESSVQGNVRITTGETGGTIKFQIASEVNSSQVVLEAGSAFVVRKVPDANMQVLAENATHSDSGTYAELFSFELAANKEYLIQTGIQWETGFTAAHIVLRRNSAPAGASVVHTWAKSHHTANDLGWFEARTGTEPGFGGSGDGGRHPAMQLTTIKTGEAGGTLSLEFRPGGDNLLTVYADSWASIRELPAGTLAADSIVSESSSAFETIKEVAVDANKTYFQRLIGDVTSSLTSSFVYQVEGIPAGATIMDGRRLGAAAGSTPTVAVARDNSLSTGPSTSVERANWTGGILAVGGTAGTLTPEFRTSSANAVTLQAGSAFICEEVTPAA